MAKYTAVGKMCWLEEAEGGRRILPSGPVYAANGRFDKDYATDELFSVVLCFPHGIRLSTRIYSDVEIGFLVPELIVSRLHPGSQILILEGDKLVGKYLVTQLKDLVLQETGALIQSS